MKLQLYLKSRLHVKMLTFVQLHFRIFLKIELNHRQSTNVDENIETKLTMSDIDYFTTTIIKKDQ